MARICTRVGLRSLDPVRSNVICADNPAVGLLPRKHIEIDLNLAEECDQQSAHAVAGANFEPLLTRRHTDRNGHIEELARGGNGNTCLGSPPLFVLSLLPRYRAMSLTLRALALWHFRAFLHSSGSPFLLRLFTAGGFCYS